MAPRKKIAAGRTKTAIASKIGFAAPAAPVPTICPPTRPHSPGYHYPLLLENRGACDALLTWFEGVEGTRDMPWRKRWIDPKDYIGREEELGKVLAKRAYEVWVSEVMLQQTRVSTVIQYYNNWISEWPTVQDLASAKHEDVLRAWKGLGYYSRATRLQEGAKQVMALPSSTHCPIPSQVSDLLKLPGIGRYTAGAISSIAFGEAEPVLDGNVARVLSRQLGLYADVKDKKVSDALWDEADRLIKYVSSSDAQNHTSDLPGKLNQALMELGSTLCTPRPRCDECPIQSTCRAYSEGNLLSKKLQSTTATTDIEDACTMCETLDIEDLVLAADGEDEEDVPQPTKKRKGTVEQANTLSNYFAVRTRHASADVVTTEEVATSKKRKTTKTNSASDPKSVAMYCGLFPKKALKKKVKEEECVVCVLEICHPNIGSKWLIEQRPATGLLASLWQFPQVTLAATATTSADRKAYAQKHVASLSLGDIDTTRAHYVAKFDPLVHVFTHLKLKMHTHHFRINVDDFNNIDIPCAGPTARWVETEAMDKETLSTGMRKCWALVEESR